ncbi:MAG: hypothetical protein ACLGI2_12630 [Acidimicrobiia bacterium]
MTAGPPLIFYSTWPLGYHNVEPERKALGLARAGFDVIYVAGVGVRNPRLSTLPKMADRLVRRVRAGSRVTTADEQPTLSSLSLLVAPPRQVAPVRRLNRAWVERQLRRAVEPWSETVVWVRWPTPELVDALETLRPAACVYECVDDYGALPEWTPRWRAIHDSAEDALLALADAVVVPSPLLAERYRARGKQVHLVPHGVDLFPWQERNRDPSDPVVVGFVGTLDYKLDAGIVGALARAHPEWRIRLVGPVQRGFPRVALTLPNITIEPPVPHAEVGRILAGIDLGLIPYVDGPGYQAQCPIKALEFLAAGRPSVAVPNPALEEYAGLMSFARTPPEFVREAERSLVRDSPELAARRRAAAEARTWDHRMAELTGILHDLVARR